MVEITYVRLYMIFIHLVFSVECNKNVLIIFNIFSTYDIYYSSTEHKVFLPIYVIIME